MTRLLSFVYTLEKKNLPLLKVFVSIQILHDLREGPLLPAPGRCVTVEQSGDSSDIEEISRHKMSLFFTPPLIFPRASRLGDSVARKKIVGKKRRVDIQCRLMPWENTCGTPNSSQNFARRGRRCATLCKNLLWGSGVEVH